MQLPTGSGLLVIAVGVSPTRESLGGHPGSSAGDNQGEPGGGEGCCCVAGKQPARACVQVLFCRPPAEPVQQLVTLEL